MSRFYVGQRVRIVKAVYEENIGREAVIKEFKFSPKGHICTNGDLLPFDSDVEITMDNGQHRSSHTSMLSPITDTYDKTSWDECMWKPEHLRTEA